MSFIKTRSQSKNRNQSDENSSPKEINLQKTKNPVYKKLLTRRVKKLSRKSPLKSTASTSKEDPRKSVELSSDSDEEQSDEVFKEALEFARAQDNLFQEYIINENIVDKLGDEKTKELLRQTRKPNSSVTLSNNQIPVTEQEMAPMSKFEIINMIRHIPFFEGKRDTTLADSLALFKMQIQNSHNMLEPEGQEFFMTVINERFRGEALAALQFKTFKKLSELLDHLSTLYEPRKDPADILRELSTCRQCLGEGIVQFAERVNKLTRQASSLMKGKYAGKDMSVTKLHINEQAKKAFIYGLRSIYIKTALCHQSNKEMEDLVEEALKWENIENQANSQENTISSQRNVLSYSTGTHEFSAEKKIRELTEKLERLERATAAGNKKISSDIRIDNLQQRLDELSTSKSTDLFCDFCRKKGHSSKECRKRINTPYCERCERYYHNASQCPQSNRISQNTGNPKLHMSKAPQIDQGYQSHSQSGQTSRKFNDRGPRQNGYSRYPEPGGRDFRNNYFKPNTTGRRSDDRANLHLKTEPQANRNERFKQKENYSERPAQGGMDTHNHGYGKPYNERPYVRLLQAENDNHYAPTPRQEYVTPDYCETRMSGNDSGAV